MSAPIELQNNERQAAIGALMTKCPEVDLGDACAAVDAIVEKVNSIRLGDPVGTLRRNPETGVVAQRNESCDGGSRYWVLLAPNGSMFEGNLLQSEVDGWTLIYEPGKASIVVHLWVPPEPEPEQTATLTLAQRPGECATPELCRDFACVGACKPEPRVIEGRALGVGEMGGEWVDDDGTGWRFDAGAFEWQASYDPTGEWYAATPSETYAPYREVIE